MKYKYTLIGLCIVAVALLVSAAAPTLPDTLSPVDEAVLFNDIELTCSGSTDGDGDTIHYAFFNTLQMSDTYNFTRGRVTDSWGHNLNYAYLRMDNGEISNISSEDDIYFYQDNITIHIRGDASIGRMRIYIDNVSKIWETTNPIPVMTPITINVSKFNDGQPHRFTFDAKSTSDDQYAIFNWSHNASSWNKSSYLAQNTTSTTYNFTTHNDIYRPQNWSCAACDTNGDCSAATTNRTYYVVALDKCDEQAFRYELLNYSIVNELNSTPINTTVSTLIRTLSPYAEGNYTITDWDVNNLAICSHSEAANFNSTQEVIIGANQSVYFQRFYYFSDVVSSTSVQYHTLYLLNQTYSNVFSADGVIINLLDTLNNQLNNSIIIVNKFIASENAFVPVERLRTNFEGKAISYLTNDALYRFIVESPIGTTVLSTDSTQIFEEPLTFIIELGDDASEQFFQYEGISYTLTYQNTTNNFIYTYNDPNGVSSNNCIRVYRLSEGEEDFLNASCSTAQSGTIFVTITPHNYTYVAKAFATIGSQSHIVDNIIEVLGQIDYAGTSGWFIVFFMTMVAVFVGFWSLVVALILLPLPMLLFSVIGLITLPVHIAISISIFVWIIAVVVARRS